MVNGKRNEISVDQVFMEDGECEEPGKTIWLFCSSKTIFISCLNVTSRTV